MFRILAFCLALNLTPVAATAQNSEIEAIIGAQLQAFQADDFATAFTFASPMIKQMFQNSERFGKMVRNGYPMVWRPADVSFGNLRLLDGRQIKTVYFTDRAGRRFEAAYEMIEGDEGWQINGVVIREADVGA